MLNTNEPAYPRQDERCPTTGHGIRKGSSGLTKRELAAFMAMQGIITSDPGGKFENAALWAVKHADALLSELERTR